MPVVKPTLVIGLGGTGKEVLLRIRRSFFEMGFVEPPRWIAFLWIDTALAREEHRYISMSGLQHPFDDVAHRTQFQEHEKCDLGLTWAELQPLLNREAKADYKNLWEWLDPNDVEAANLNPDGLTKGARQSPLLGRLALYLRAQYVIAKLGESLKGLNRGTVAQGLRTAQLNSTMPEMPSAGPIEVAEGCDAFIVGSLAGGTGGGLCVDLAAMLKAEPTLCRETAICPNVSGFFLLPDAFLRDPRIDRSPNFDRSRAKANGYLMLQEIENMSLVRGGQWLTGRSDSGIMRAAWLFPAAPENAPEIRAPIYSSVTLFDGFVEGSNALSAISDSYATVSHLLFNTLKADLLGARNPLRPGKMEWADSAVHLETFPSSPLNPRGPQRQLAQNSRQLGASTKWCEVQSFRFATAGISRVTREMPRLRQMAAYTLVSEALHRWQGEPNPRQIAARNAVPTRRDRRAALLRMNVEARLIQEYQVRTTDSRQRWLDIFAQSMKWETLEKLRSENNPLPTPSVFLDAFKTADTQPQLWNAREMAAVLRDYYLIGRTPRIDAIFREVVDTIPLAGWTALPDASMYRAPGGLAAIDYAIAPRAGTQDSQPIVQTVLRKMAKLYTEKAALLRPRIDELRAQISGLLDEYLRADAALQYAMRPYEFVSGATKDALKQAMARMCDSIRPGLILWMESIQDASLCNSFASALEILSGEKAAFEKLLAGWMPKVSATRTFLAEMLDGKRDESEATIQQPGVDRVLADLRALPADALTIQIDRAIQTDEQKLRNEITQAAGGKQLVEQSLGTIQTLFLDKCHAMLDAPASGSGSGLTAGRFTSVVDVATHPERERVPFDAFMDILVAAGRKQRGSELLLSDPSRPGTADSLNDLTQLNAFLNASRCRLDIRTPRGRNPIPYNTNADALPPVQEYHFVAGHQVNVQNASLIQTADPFETTSVRFEYELPISNIRWTQSAGEAALSTAGSGQHFFRPRSGYPPIHALSEPEAATLMRRAKAALMALILGQFRVHPESARDGGGDYFDFMAESGKSWNPLRFASALPDIVQHLGSTGELGKFLERIERRNAQVLADISPIARFAVRLILEYNSRAAEKFGCIMRETASGDHESSARLAVPGPMNLVLAAMIQDLDALDATSGEIEGRSVARELLADFMHHFSHFQPLHPRASHSPRLLCLSVEWFRFGDLANPDADLLLHRKPALGPPSEIHQKFSLKAPWLVYTQTRGLGTLAFHAELAGNQHLSMFPPDANGEWSRPRPHEWDTSMYVSEIPVRPCEFYPTIFKKSTWANLLNERDAENLKKLRLNAMNRFEEEATPPPAPSSPVNAAPNPDYQSFRTACITDVPAETTAHVQLEAAPPPGPPVRPATPVRSVRPVTPVPPPRSASPYVPRSDSKKLIDGYDRLVGGLERRIFDDGIEYPYLASRDIYLISRLGGGGMGSVYLGIEGDLKKERAVKIMDCGSSADATFTARFKLEAQLAVQLNSPNLVEVHYAGVERGLHYIVMGYVFGMTAGEWLKREQAAGRRTSEADALTICKAATHGLECMHYKHVIHRDIKPGNIFIPFGHDDKTLQLHESKLGDLGLARKDDGGEGLTAGNIIMGTPGFASPEQIDSSAMAGTPSDVFSMGATLYTLLAGKQPWSKGNSFAILRATKSEPFEPLANFRNDLSPAVVALICNCLEKVPENRRCQDGRQLLAAMQSIALCT